MDKSKRALTVACLLALLAASFAFGFLQTPVAKAGGDCFNFCQCEQYQAWSGADPICDADNYAICYPDGLACAAAGGTPDDGDGCGFCFFNP
jgi:hypothetical protein